MEDLQKNFYSSVCKNLRQQAFWKRAEFSSRSCRFVLNTEGELLGVSG